AALGARIPGRTHAARCRGRCHDTDVCVNGGGYTSGNADEGRHAVSGRTGATAARTDRAVSLSPDRVGEAARRTRPLAAPRRGPCPRDAWTGPPGRAPRGGATDPAARSCRVVGACGAPQGGPRLAGQGCRVPERHLRRLEARR